MQNHCFQWSHCFSTNHSPIRFLCLRVMLKALQLPLFSFVKSFSMPFDFFFSFSSTFLDGITNLAFQPLKTLYLPTTMSMATKLGRVVIYYEGLSPITAHDPLITWLCKITWETKPITSPPTQCLSTPDLVGWWLTISKQKARWEG